MGSISSPQIGVKSSLDSSIWRVFGDLNINYLDFSIDNTNFTSAGSLVFDYDATTNYFGVTETDGVKLYKLDTTTENTTDPGCKATQSDAASYTMVKYTGDNRLRYGTERISSKPDGYIYYALDGTTCDPDSSTSNSIQFIANRDFESDGTTQLTHKKTIAFDVMNMPVDSNN